LTGCQNKINNIVPNIDLPELPLISKEANKELKTAFNPVCIKINDHIKDLKISILNYNKDNPEDIIRIKNREDLISELNIVCSPKSFNTKIWLDELYKFKIRYYIYKEELQK
jgi:hypothetical protein